MSEKKRPYVDPEPLSPEAIRETKDILKNEGWVDEGLVRFHQKDPNESPQDRDARLQQLIANVDKMRDIEAGETTVDLRTYIHMYSEQAVGEEEIRKMNKDDENSIEARFLEAKIGSGSVGWPQENRRDWDFDYELWYKGKQGDLRKVLLRLTRINEFKNLFFGRPPTDDSFRWLEKNNLSLPIARDLKEKLLNLGFQIDQVDTEYQDRKWRLVYCDALEARRKEVEAEKAKAGFEF